MKRILVTIAVLFLASTARAAKQDVAPIAAPATLGAYRTAVNAELAKVKSNTDELYSLAIAAPWLAQTTAPNITNVFWVDTSGASPVIKYWDGDSWEVAAAGGEGTYTLPTASSTVLGGVKVGARLTITDGVLSADAQSGGTDDQTAAEVNITDSGGYFSATQVEAALQEIGLNYALKSNYLALNNTSAFTPDADYEPATKKYVDDSITAGGGYTDEQAQDAVGGMFTGNTETGITVAYDDATAKTNFVVDTQLPGVASTGITGSLTLTKAGSTARTVTFPDAVGTVALTSDIPAAITDATITTTDVTTNNASTTKHGFAVKATAPASGLRNVMAIDNAETVYKNAALFDATAPSTQALSDAAVVGTAMTAARRDHKHAMPPPQTTVSGNAGTATALASNGANCSAGQAALGVDASGAAEGCWTPSTGSMTYPSSNNFGWTTNGTTWSSMGLDTDISSVSASDDTIPSAKATKAALDLKVSSGTAGYVFNMSALTDLQYGGATLIDDTATNGATTRLWSADKVYDQIALKQDADTDLTTWAGVTPGTGVATALAVNVGSAGAPVLFNGAGGTPSSLTLTNALLANSTSLPGTCTVGQVYQDTNADTDGDVYFCRATNIWKAIDDDGGAGGLATTDIDTSAELRTILTDEVGTGAAYFVGGALGTPASATLTNATGLPVSGITASTSTALGVGTLELGAASDTTLARSGAGAITVESVPITLTIASGTSALGTGAITSGACASVVTTTATNTATTDVINWGFNGDPTGVTGYAPSANGMLTIIAYPSAGNVNYKVCNNTAASITPGAITLNWRVVR